MKNVDLTPSIILKDRQLYWSPSYYVIHEPKLGITMLKEMTLTSKHLKT